MQGARLQETSAQSAEESEDEARTPEQPVVDDCVEPGDQLVGASTLLRDPFPGAASRTLSCEPLVVLATPAPLGYLCAPGFTRTRSTPPRLKPRLLRCFQACGVQSTPAATAGVGGGATAIEATPSSAVRAVDASAAAPSTSSALPPLPMETSVPLPVASNAQEAIEHCDSVVSRNLEARPLSILPPAATAAQHEPEGAHSLTACGRARRRMIRAIRSD